nr:uncharacterized protein LOC123757830 isoform X2 [Procambarus clarkii]
MWVCNKVFLSLVRAFAFTNHFKIGLHLGTSSGKQDHNHHYCTDSREQLLKNLYVDYFHSLGPCITSDGSKVYTFRNTDQSSGDNTHTYSSLCAKVPTICKLSHQSGHRTLEAGQMVKTFRDNIRRLYHPITSHGSPLAIPPPTLDLRNSMGRPRDEPIVYQTECGHRRCSEHGVSVCDSVKGFVFPVVGQSAISNTTVTIVQAFPDLVQPVFFRKCRTENTQIAHGKCVQDYLPVGFLVSPTLPGAVVAQDFVMVESGCHLATEVTHYRDKQLQDNFTTGVYTNIDKMRESDRRLF